MQLINFYSFRERYELPHLLNQIINTRALNFGGLVLSTLSYYQSPPCRQLFHKNYLPSYYTENL